MLTALERVDVHHHNQRAIHLVVEGPVGTHAQRVPASAFVAHLEFLLAHAGDDFSAEAFQVERGFRGVTENEVVLYVPDRPSDVGDQQVELLFRMWAETADVQVGPKQHDGDLGRGLEVEQVAVEAVELDVPIRQLVVHGGQLFVGRLQLFVGRLQLFLGGLQLLVAALQLFVGGLNFLFGRLKLLAGRLELPL